MLSETEKRLEEEKLQNALVDNFVNEKGRIVESQLGHFLFTRWDSLMKELYICAIQYKKEWYLKSDTTQSTVRSSLYSMLKTILDDVIGNVNGFPLQKSADFANLAVVYTKPQPYGKDKLSSEEYFILKIESFFARKIIEQKLKSRKLIECDLEDQRAFRRLKANKRKRRKRAQSNDINVSDSKNEKLDKDDKDEKIDSNINEVTSPSKPLWTDKHTLYIYKKKTGCHLHNHDFISATAVLTGQNNAQIKLNAEYCTQCKRFFMSYIVYEMYRERYGILLGKIRMEDTLSSDFGEVVLSEFSPLKLCGYSVSMKRGLSSAERQYIISKVIELGVLKKNDVIRYLEHFITMNGKKDGNEVALSKWKEDLDFTLKYKLYDQQQHNIYQVKKY